MSVSIYLAGPDVFRQDAIEIGKAKKALCEQYGFIGHFPLDNSLDLAGLTTYQQGLAIYQANIELMQKSDCIIANMTPFRGPGMDQGTAFEIGYMTSLNKPVFAYTLETRNYADRIQKDENGFDPAGLQVESFSMADNLMLIGAIEQTGGQLFSYSGIDSNTEDHLEAFEQTIKLLTINPILMIN